MLLTEFDEKLYKKSVYREGYEDGREQAIRSSISMLKSIGISDDKIITLIAENYSVRKEDILNILKKDK